MRTNLIWRVWLKVGSHAEDGLFILANVCCVDIYNYDYVL
jgi:hypothetical protein